MSFKYASTLFALLLVQNASAENWPMRQKDCQHTGRADYQIPATRLNSSLLDHFRWQQTVPGGLSSTSLAFQDDVGLDDISVVAGGYHWPKGVQGMDRNSGRLLWAGNPRGGETIGRSTPAFSPDGNTIYVINDATGSVDWPAGHPLMGFSAITGPGTYWHNGLDANPGELSMQNPTIDPEGRIFLFSWVDRPAAGLDLGDHIAQVWRANTHGGTGYSDPSIWTSPGDTSFVVAAGRNGDVSCWLIPSGEEYFQINTGIPLDATTSIDPATGNIYAGAGFDHVKVVGLDCSGMPLWDEVAMPVFQHEPGVNTAQRAQSAGCLSHDGATYYFQTNAQDASGRLYAIRTLDGSVKWSYPTQSEGWELSCSSPIVTQDSVLIVGNNYGNTYYALQDAGSEALLLDSLVVDASGNALASATLSTDGLLYLPLRTTWTTLNEDDFSPDGELHNLFAAIDLTANPHVWQPEECTMLSAPEDQGAFAGSQQVELTWTAVSDPFDCFNSYAIYRSASPFSSVQGMTPLAYETNILSQSFVDNSAQDGDSWYYALTTISESGEDMAVESIGPRTPWTESDIQVVRVSREPFFPRYDAQYSYYTVTEANGFGPYIFSAATSLGSGQDEMTQRWPQTGETVWYRAQVRNRGTEHVSGTVIVNWMLDGENHDADFLPAFSLYPGEEQFFETQLTWDGLQHEVRFDVLLNDDRPENNHAMCYSKSAQFLSYIDRTRLEEFREESSAYPDAASDDFIDWLNRHVTRLNEMFVDTDCDKRINYAVLDVLADTDTDPLSPAHINFAIFPFRFHGGEGSLRTSGYYDSQEDLDFGLLHEMAHQLGLIDLYRLNLSPEGNQVSGLGYSTGPGLMHGVSPFLSEHSAHAMQHWLDKAHGYYGQYIYQVPTNLSMQFLDNEGGPLAGAVVEVYQKCERPSIGELITDQVKFQGTTDGSGFFALPNVELDTLLVPTTFAGDKLRDNPFGYLAVVGTNGLLHFKVTHQGFSDYAWLDIVEANNAYWNGQQSAATFQRQLCLGGEISLEPPEELTESNANDWSAWSNGGTTEIQNDADSVRFGATSIRFETVGDVMSCRFPGNGMAIWDLSTKDSLVFLARSTGTFAFQNHSPWIRIGNADGYIELHATWDIINESLQAWKRIALPLAGNADWTRTEAGISDLSEVNHVEIWTDIWDSGYTFWLDGMRFTPPGPDDCDDPTPAVPQDLQIYYAQDQVHLSWSPVTQNIHGCEMEYSPMFGYQVHMDTEPTFTNPPVYTWTSETVMSFDVDTETLFFRVIAEEPFPGGLAGSTTQEGKHR